MTNKEIFESLKTAKWEQRSNSDKSVMVTYGDEWTAYIEPDGILHIHTDRGRIRVRKGIIHEVNDIIMRAELDLANIWHEWLEK